MSVYDSSLNSSFKQNQFSANSSDKKSGPALSQSADRTIQRIQGFQSKITETNSAKASILDKQKAFGRIEAKALKANEFLNEVNENFSHLVTQKEKLVAELEELYKQNNDLSADLISEKEEEIHSLTEQIQGLETIRNAPDYKGASIMVSNALQQVRASLTELQNIVELASKLSEKFPICQGLSEDQKQQLYLASSRDTIESMMPMVSLWMPKEMNATDKFQLLIRILSLSSKDMDDLVLSGSKTLTSLTNNIKENEVGGQKVSTQVARVFASILASVPESEREELFSNILKLKKSFELSDITLLVALILVPHEERSELVEYTAMLVTENMARSVVKAVIEAVAKIPQGERAEIAKSVAKLMTEELYGTDVLKVIQALYKIPQEERAELVECTAMLAPESLLGNVLGQVMEALVKFPKDERTEIAKYTVTLMPKNTGARINVIYALGRVPQEEREKLVELTAKLVTEQMIGDDVVNIMRSLLKVPKGDRGALVECIAKLVTAIWGNGLAHAIDGLATIPEGERAELMKYTADLRNEKMSAGDQVGVMRFLARIPEEERAQFVEFTAKLVTKAMDGTDVINVMLLLQNISQGDRKELVNSTAKLVTEWMSFLNIVYTYNYNCHDPITSQVNLLMEFQSICDKKETIEEKQDSYNQGLNWLQKLFDGFRAEKISSAQLNFLLDKGFLKAAINYRDVEVRSRLSLCMIDSVKHQEIYKNIWDEKLPPHTKIPLILIAGLKAQGLEEKAVQELLATARNNSFKDGKNLKIFVDAIVVLLEAKELSNKDKEFILSKIKLPPKSDKLAVKATFSSLHAIIAFKVINRLSALSKNQLEKSSINEILQKTITDLIPMEAMPNFEEHYAKYFGTDRVPNFLLTYAAKLESLPGEKDTMLKYLGGTVESILKGDFPSIRYDMKGKHLNTVFSERADLLEEWKKGKKVSLGDYVLQTDAKVKPANFQSLLKEKIITNQHIKKELVPQLYAFLDEGMPQQIDGTDPLSIIQKNCIELTSEKLSLEEQKNLLKEINKTLGQIEEGEEFKNDISGFLSGLIKQNEVVTSYNRFTIEDTDNYLDLFLSGQEVAGSCQRVDGEPSLNKCLLGYVADGKNRLLAIKDKDGRIIARQIFRILWDGEKPVLLTEPIYPSLVNPNYENAVKLFAKQRAKELGLPLLTVTVDKSLQNYGKAIYSLDSPAPYEYSDTADRGLGGVTKGIYTISNAKIIQD